MNVNEALIGRTISIMTESGEVVKRKIAEVKQQDGAYEVTFTNGEKKVFNRLSEINID